MKLLSLIVALIGFLCAECAEVGADVGNWTVGECIMAQFAMQFSIDARPTVNLTLIVEVPRDAKVDQDTSECQKDLQSMTLKWSDPALNDTGKMLDRNLTFVFKKDNKTSMQSYGVERIFATFHVAEFSMFNNETNKTDTVKSYLNLDTDDTDKFFFLTPIGRSFLCSDTGDISFLTTLKYTLPNSAPGGTALNSTLAGAKHVQADAFREKDATPNQFQIPLDCDYRPNDVVPIVVGIVLAVLIVGILVAYMIGRRRHRQRGYQSV